MTEPVLDRMFATLLAGVEAATITLGDRLGLWAALGAAARSPAELADACGVAERYTLEWLEAMAAAGLLSSRPPRFALADGVREVLVDAESPTYLLPLLRQMTAATASLRALETAYRAGTGLAWAQHDPDVREAQGAANRVALRDDLPAWVSAHLPDTAAKLRAGGRAGDVGAGHGWASVGLATGFPASQVDAFEPDGPSAQQARANTVGLAVEVHSRPLAADDGPYDLLVLAEMLHDVPHPVDLLATCARTLRARGTVLVVDMAAAETLTTPAEPMQRLFYGFSLLVCLPDSMSTPGSAATGTVLRPSVLAGYARQAGLTITGVLPVEHDVWRIYVLTQPGVNAV